MSKSGFLTDGELITVPGGRLTGAAAAAWNGLRADALHDAALTLTIVQPKPAVAANTPGSYRSNATSLDMRARPQLYNITPGVLPGLPSDHNDGTCVDVGNGLAWLTANNDKRLHDRGFVRDRIKTWNDYNHIHYVGVQAAGGDLTAITADEPAKEDDDMALIRVRNSDNGSIAIAQVGGGLFHEFSDPAYETLYNGWGLWDRAKDLNLPGPIYDHYKALAAEARGSVDATALAAQVIAKLPTSVGTVDVKQLAAAVDAALSDNFAAIPADVLDAESKRLQN